MGVAATLLMTPVSSLIAQDQRADGPESKIVLEKLEDKVGMQFPNPTPLEDVLNYIKAASQGPADDGIPFAFDADGMKRAGKTHTSRVTIDIKDEPMKTSLRKLLKPLGLTYVVKTGVLTITSEPAKFKFRRFEDGSRATRGVKVSPAIGAGVVSVSGIRGRSDPHPARLRSSVSWAIQVFKPLCSGSSGPVFSS